MTYGRNLLTHIVYHQNVFKPYKMALFLLFGHVSGLVLSAHVYVRKLEWRKHAELFQRKPKSRFIYVLKSGCHEIPYGNYGKFKSEM